MKIISNHQQPNHRSVVTRLLKHADEAVICVAFLKESGLRSLIAKLPKRCTCYIGTDYYLTEPAALRQLLERGVKVYLPKQAKATFHPKVYYVRKRTQVSILIGSANLTGGGLETNVELSVVIEAKSDRNWTKKCGQ